MNKIKIERRGPHVTVERTLDYEGIRPDLVMAWSFEPHEWDAIKEFVLLEIDARRYGNG